MEINEEDLSLRVNAEFQNSYLGEPLDVEFTFNRLTMRRCHCALEQARQFGENVLFPSRVVLQEPLWSGEWAHEEEEEDSGPEEAEKEGCRSPGTRSESILRACVDMVSVATQTNPDAVVPRRPIPKSGQYFIPGLNPAQREAVKRILAGECRPTPYILFGPPGTGKTITLIEAILQVYHRIPSSRLLVCTPSNSAADLICLRLHHSGFLHDASLVRVNATCRQEESIQEVLRQYCRAGEDLRHASFHRIVVSTCSSAGMFYQIGLRVGHFTHVFIDEAGQATEPEALIPLGLLSERDGQMVLAGDLGSWAGGEVSAGLGVWAGRVAAGETDELLFYSGELCTRAPRAVVESLCYWSRLSPKASSALPWGRVEKIRVLLSESGCRTLKWALSGVPGTGVPCHHPVHSNADTALLTDPSTVLAGTFNRKQQRRCLMFVLVCPSQVRVQRALGGRGLTVVLGFLSNLSASMWPSHAPRPCSSSWATRMPSSRLNVVLGGMTPLYFHMVNVCLHCAVSVLLMLTCERSVFQDGRPAFLTALLFAVHPIHTEAVSGIVGRADVLACLLFLLSFLSYVRSIDRTCSGETAPPTVSYWSLLLSLLLGTCAMLVKETGVTVFGVCVVYDALVLCRKPLLSYLSCAASKDVPRAFSPCLKRTCVVTAYVAIIMSFRLWVMGGSMPLFSEQDNPASFCPHVLTRFLTYCYLLAFNAWLLLAPTVLCYDWQVGSIPLVESLWDVRNIATLLLGVALLCLCLHCFASLQRPEQKEVLVGLLFLVFPFIPASNLFFRVGFVVAERVLYMPRGIVLLQGSIAVGMLPWGRKFAAEHHRHGDTSFTAEQCCCGDLSRGTPGTEASALQSAGFASYFCGGRARPPRLTLSLPRSRLLNQLQERRRVRFVKERLPLGAYLKDECVYGVLHPGSTRAEQAVLAGGRWGSTALTVATPLLLLLFSWKTIQQNEIWLSREALFRSGIQTLPHNAKVHYNYANFLKDRGRNQEAIHHYKTALRLYPRHASAMNNLGTLTRHPEDAERYYRRALEINPQHNRALFNLGNLLKTQGKAVEAERMLRDSILFGPHFADAYSSLASLFAEQKRFAEANETYLQGIESCPDSSDLHNNYGVFLVDTGDSETASVHYQHAVRLKPAHYVAMVNLGRLLRSSNENKEAEAWYKRALQVARKVEILTPLGALYYNTGRYEEALQVYREAAALQPESADIWLALAQVLAMAGRSKEAEKMTFGIISKNGGCVECYRLLSAIYSKRGSHEEALNALDKALQLSPSEAGVQAELHFSVGNQLREMNMLERAYESYKSAVELNPDQSQAWMNMGGIQHIKGDYSLARKYYQKALQLSPGSKLLQENLAKLDRLEKRQNGL
ncbi:hypothetical protein GJAV_G00272540 [Gymnothorax javanicus]|nr:hypothetical protein GJAV_G00272540 [Gymnothorax javanicus]